MDRWNEDFVDLRVHQKKGKKSHKMLISGELICIFAVLKGKSAVWLFNNIILHSEVYSDFHLTNIFTYQTYLLQAWPVTFDFRWTSGDKSQRLSKSSMESHEKRNYFRCVRCSCSTTITFSLKRKRKERKRGSVHKFLLHSLSKEVLPLSLSSFFTLLSLIAVHTGNTHTGADAVNSLFFKHFGANLLW